ncbi:MAG: thioredoxin fold domain-containing protein, partial [Alphaproteobacteria bacterium]|nr:thioredoxin fold domain-containing protein [Alphaproteobacteria bacterium]
GFVTGILFNKDGKTVTIDQVSRLRGQSEGAFLDQLTADAPPSSVTETAQQQAEKYEFKTPSEQLYFDIENSNWVPIGQAGTPIVYSFIDPQCPHCHEMMRDLRNDIQAGRLQVRLIPVGFKEESKAQAAYLLATPGPEEVWWRHLDGDKEVLPAKRQINEQGVQRNLSVMQSWKLSVTPLMVYRAKDGSVKIIRGKPKDVPSFIGDLGART